MTRPEEHPTPPAGLSVFIMAYNEARTIEEVVRRTDAFLAARFDRYETVVVDDGSTDGTGRIADRLAAGNPHVRVVHHAANRGIGAAIRSGLAACRYEWVAMLCADLQFHPEDLERLLPALKDHGVVVATRPKRQDPLVRRAITQAEQWLLRTLLGVRLRDVHWVKIMRRDVLQHVRLRSSDVSVDVELLYRASRLGVPMTNVAAPHYPRTHGTAKGASWRNLWQSLKGYWRLWQADRPTRRARRIGLRARPASEGDFHASRVLQPVSSV